MRGTLHIYENHRGWKWKIHCNREKQDIIIKSERAYKSKAGAKGGAKTTAIKLNVILWGIDYL